MNAEIKIEKILETESISQYNKWVKKNKERYPGLMPMYFKVEMINNMKKYKIQYFNEEGNLLKEEFVEGENINVYTDERNRIFIRKRNNGGTTIEVKDKFGNSLFVVKNIGSLFYLPKNLYIGEPPIEEDVTESPYLLIFNGKGELIKILELKGCVDFSTIRIPTDSSYTLLRIVGGKDETILMIDSNGNEVWRRKFVGTHFVPFISKDGSKIGLNFYLNKKIEVYNKNGEFEYIYEISEKEGSSLYNSSFSLNGSYLITGTNYIIYFYDNNTHELIWRKTIKERPKKFDFVLGDNYILVAYLSNDIHFYDKRGNLIGSFKIPLRESESFKKVFTEEGVKFMKKIKPEWKWDIEFIEPLIIIKSMGKIFIYEIKI